LSLPTDLPAFPLSDIGDPRTMNLSLSAVALSILGYPVQSAPRLLVASPGAIQPVSPDLAPGGVPLLDASRNRHLHVGVFQAQ
jgi:hypothetical protein